MNAKSLLRVNGENHEYDDDALPDTVAALISELGLDPSMLVAEVNGEIVGRADFSSRGLCPGDEVELVRFVGGG